jgi:hypothetical protein
VSLMPYGLRQLARSISRLSPILSSPAALLAIKIASLILRPDSRLVDVTSFQSVRRRSLSFGSSSLISRRRHCLSVSFLRLRPPGNIQSLSRRRRTSRTRPRLEATNFDDLAIYQNASLEVQQRTALAAPRSFSLSNERSPFEEAPRGASQFTVRGGLHLHLRVCLM